MVVSRFCAHENWKAIADVLKEKLSKDYQINPFISDKVLLRFEMVDC